MKAYSRKDDHIRLAAEQQKELAAGTKRSDFDDIEFIYHALNPISVEEVSTETVVGPWKFPAPLYINGMTGGTDTAMPINRALAQAAAATGTPMASGSVGIALDDPSTADSFTVIRKENPDGIVWANIGAGRGLDDARRAVELLNADGLQIHLNAIQETVMPEGSRDFSTWLDLIEEITAALDDDGIPVIVKEVGAGLSAATVKQLHEIGVTIIDVAGSGGTNFARIENDRGPEAYGDDSALVATHRDFSWINSVGLSTPECLVDLQATPFGLQGPSILASGGIRNPMDVARSLAMGAQAAGVAGVFLRVAMTDGAEALAEVITIWRERIAQIQALFGVRTPAELSTADVMIRGELAEFARLRGINLGNIAHGGR